MSDDENDAGEDYHDANEEVDDVSMDDDIVGIGEPDAVRAGKRIPNEERTTSRFMTKYERARILGVRALQISMSAPVMVDLGTFLSFPLHSFPILETSLCSLSPPPSLSRSLSVSPLLTTANKQNQETQILSKLP